MEYNFTKPPCGAKINHSHSLAKGIVGCWLFNEGMGNKVYDLSGNGNTGTLVNMQHPGSNINGWGSGKFRNKIGFYNPIGYEGRYVIFPDGALRLTTAISISVWFWINNWNTIYSYDKIISYQTNTNWSGSYISFCIGANGGPSTFKPIVVFSTSNTYSPALNSLTDPNTINLKTWYNYTATFDGIKISFYRNGYLVGQKNLSGEIYYGTYPHGLTLGTGGAHYLYEQLNGSIDLPVIYNRALSPSEVLQLYTSPFCFIN